MGLTKSDNVLILKYTVQYSGNIIIVEEAFKDE